MNINVPNKGNQMKVKSLITILMLSLAFTPTIVTAEWNAETKAEILKNLEAIRSAELASVYALVHAADMPAESPLAAQFIRMMAIGWEQHVRGVFWLLDVNAIYITSPPSTILADETREQIIERGFAELAEADRRYTAANAILATMTAGTHGHNVAAAQLGIAQSAAQTINKTLDYTEPRLDENLAQPIGSREASSNFGPHGGYRFQGQVASTWSSWHSDQWQAIADILDADHSLGSYLAFIGQHAGNVGKAMMNSVGLFAGVESPEDARHLDIMEAGGTTTRSRHFFRGLLISEYMLAFTHQGRPPSIDINGRTMKRGIAYDLTVACNRYADEIGRIPGLAPKAIPLLEAIKLVCSEWTQTDDFIQSGVVTLKWNQVFAAPPPRNGGDLPPFRCGAGTTEDANGTCVADIQSCPGFAAQMSVGIDGIVRAECVAEQ